MDSLGSPIALSSDTDDEVIPIEIPDMEVVPYTMEVSSPSEEEIIEISSSEENNDAPKISVNPSSKPTLKRKSLPKSRKLGEEYDSTNFSTSRPTFKRKLGSNSKTEYYKKEDLKENNNLGSTQKKQKSLTVHEYIAKCKRHMEGLTNHSDSSCSDISDFLNNSNIDAENPDSKTNVTNDSDSDSEIDSNSYPQNVVCHSDEDDLENSDTSEILNSESVVIHNIDSETSDNEMADYETSDNETSDHQKVNHENVDTNSEIALGSDQENMILISDEDDTEIGDTNKISNLRKTVNKNVNSEISGSSIIECDSDSENPCASETDSEKDDTESKINIEQL